MEEKSSFASKGTILLLFFFNLKVFDCVLLKLVEYCTMEVSEI